MTLGRYTVDVKFIHTPLEKSLFLRFFGYETYHFGTLYTSLLYLLLGRNPRTSWAELIRTLPAAAKSRIFTMFTIIHTSYHNSTKLFSTVISVSNSYLCGSESSTVLSKFLCAINIELTIILSNLLIQIYINRPIEDQHFGNS